MAGGGSQRPTSQHPAPPRARAAAHPTPLEAAPRRGWTRIDPRAPIPPALLAFAEHFLVAGPIFGVLSAMYSYHLVLTASPVFSPATHEVIRQTQAWHGRALRSYFITPQQNLIWWVLSVPAVAWLILLVCSIVALGVRSHYGKKPTGVARRSNRKAP